jgi:hypothetical protein
VLGPEQLAQLRLTKETCGRTEYPATLLTAIPEDVKEAVGAARPCAFLCFDPQAFTMPLCVPAADSLGLGVCGSRRSVRGQTVAVCRRHLSGSKLLTRAPYMLVSLIVADVVLSLALLHADPV